MCLFAVFVIVNSAEGFVVHGDVDQDGVEAVEEPEAVSNKASGSESDEDDSPKKKKRRRRLSGQGHNSHTSKIRIFILQNFLGN